MDSSHMLPQVWQYFAAELTTSTYALEKNEWSNEKGVYIFQWWIEHELCNLEKNIFSLVQEEKSAWLQFFPNFFSVQVCVCILVLTQLAIFWCTLSNLAFDLTPFTLWTASMCGSRLDLVVKIFPQCGHGSDSSFSPMWMVRTCRSRWPFLLKTLPHSVHLAGLKIWRPKWTCSMCLFKVHFLLSSLQQWGHTTPSISGWSDLTWSSMSFTTDLQIGHIFLSSIFSKGTEKVKMNF